MEKHPNATTQAPHTAAVKSGAAGPQAEPDQATHRALFVGMALEMSWQLAVVVLVPIVGGYMLDGRLHSTPWLTLIGLVIAAAGVFGVLIRIVKEAERRTGTAKPKGPA